MTKRTSMPKPDDGPEDISSDGDEMSNVETRRNFLTLIALDGIIHTLLVEDRGHSEIEAIWLALRAICLELVATSIKTHELKEKAATLDVGVKVSGAFLSGVLGSRENEHDPSLDDTLETLDEVNALDDAVKVERLHLIAHRTGVAIREGAGIGAAS